ncbi:GCN5-related N-acetyltransferase [Sphingomonas qomolangmaensis]|uniref:GCN5-related N-acetyltransferase n=1 Tax=Sphingomonas qomolangmaensis TaxID=2918765 RepID=A0ABY5L4A2_9SPHN|nr:GCN5-related N-acetyltransferase [Sphingomonas qomolangmaensis]UUL81322.1 GCN5-related N-acetyltransferase [Sphingomonas qomolangmaensis]
MRREELEAEWLTLTRETLPQAAAARGWPIARDHCFQRVLLDAATGGCWYDAIPGRPAYRHAAPEMLAGAIGLGRAVLAGSEDVAALNLQSLRWRGKR